MLLRPASAVWFEMLVARTDLASALGCLASGGDVELESQVHGSVSDLLPRLRTALDEYGRLTQRYASYWPGSPISAADAEPREEVEAISAAALEHLHAWAAAADPLIAQLQKLQHERIELAYLERLFSQAPAPLPAFNLLFNAGPVLAGRIYLLEIGTGLGIGIAGLTLPASVLAQRIDCVEHSYLLAVGPSEQIGTLDGVLNALKARRLEFPPALGAADDGDTSARLEARLAQIAKTTHELHAQLTARGVEFGLSTALTDMALVGWFADHVPEFARTDHFVRITGWSSDPTGRRLDACLHSASIHYLVHFSSPPPQLTPPIVLRNPRWARPFEFFARLLGIPGASEADPSVLLALLAPLMFGFMFGDVGQGAVLVAAGFALRKRYPAAELLIAGGLAAMVFGTLFGSVFAREDILPALWLHPLAQPLRLLEVSLVGGSVVILIGLALDALESYWRGAALRWWATRAGLVLSYLAAIACVLDPRAEWLIPAGLLWYCGGELAFAEHPAQRLGASIGEAIQTLLQLLVNTLSFVRIGAFALAHAGLAAAVNALCTGIGTRWLALLGLVLGNALIIVIEGLVVGIQTTRLVLFEFFIRFLRGDGRALKPLPALLTTVGIPTSITMELSRKSS